MRKYTSIPFTEYDVAIGSFDGNRRPIDRIVLHTTVGTIEATKATFASTKGTSAHYTVGWDGKLYAFLEEYNVAYATGNYPMNQRSISIEHVDNGQYTSVRPDALYETSAKLVADICREYGIPCDRSHILKHNEVVATGCPHNLDVDRIIKRANEIMGGKVMDEDTKNADRWKNLVYDNPYGWSEPDHVRATIEELKQKERDRNEAINRKDEEILLLKKQIETDLAKCELDAKNQIEAERTKLLMEFGREKESLLKEIEELKKSGPVKEVPVAREYSNGFSVFLVDIADFFEKRYGKRQH